MLFPVLRELLVLKCSSFCCLYSRLASLMPLRRFPWATVQACLSPDLKAASCSHSCALTLVLNQRFWLENTFIVCLFVCFVTFPVQKLIHPRTWPAYSSIHIQLLCLQTHPSLCSSSVHTCTVLMVGFTLQLHGLYAGIRLREMWSDCLMYA